MNQCPKTSCILKDELVAYIEVLMEFVEICYTMEGDGELVFTVENHLDRLHEVYPNNSDLSQIPSVNCLIEQYVQFV